jgi:uncharacterized membrane protein
MVAMIIFTTLFFIFFNKSIYATEIDDIHWTQKIFRIDEQQKKNIDDECLPYNKNNNEIITKDLNLTKEICQSQIREKK